MSCTTIAIEIITDLHVAYRNDAFKSKEKVFVFVDDQEGHLVIIKMIVYLLVISIEQIRAIMLIYHKFAACNFFFVVFFCSTRVCYTNIDVVLLVFIVFVVVVFNNLVSNTKIQWNI